MPRPVSIATTSLLLRDVATYEENMEAALSLARQALECKPDIVLLPELFAVINLSPAEAVQYAETVPGGVTRPFQALAQEAGCYFIVPLLEHDRTVLRNSAAIIGRGGEIVGRYHKTHLAPGEAEAYHVVPGDDYPVFECDFGKIGVMICMDIHYPEVARIMALGGAEIIFWPTMAYGPTGHFLETQFRCRAMDNQVYVVASNYMRSAGPDAKFFLGRACIVGPDGDIRADTGNQPGVAVTTVDLDERMPSFWGPDHPAWKHIFLSCRRPETYAPLLSGWIGM